MQKHLLIIKKDENLTFISIRKKSPEGHAGISVLLDRLSAGGEPGRRGGPSTGVVDEKIL